MLPTTDTPKFTIPFFPQPLFKAQAKMSKIKTNLGKWKGLNIIAYGPKGGKIVGYRADGTKIYAGSKAAENLAKTQKAKKSGKWTPALQDKSLAQWLYDLGLQGALTPSFVKVSEATAKMLSESFGVAFTVIGSGYATLDKQELLEHVGEPLKPSPEEEMVWAAKVASGVDEDSGMPDLQTLTEIPAGKYSGTHHNRAFKDSKGKIWVFKSENPTIARAEEAANRIGRMLMGNKFPRAEYLQVDGKDGVLIEVLGGNELTGSDHSDPKKTLLKKHALDVVRHQVVDWLISNHDAHAGNFLSDKNMLNAIDKGQAWKWIGKDVLNGKFKGENPSDPVYKTFWNEVFPGIPEESKFLVLKAMADMLDAVEKITPEQYESIIKPYVATSTGWSGKSPKALIDTMVGRLKSMRSDFQKFLSSKGLELPASESKDNFETMPEVEAEPEPFKAKKTVHLQGIGKHPAKAAGDFKVGDSIVYNYGVKGEVLSVKKQGAWVFLETLEDGKEFTSKKKATTLLGVSEAPETKPIKAVIKEPVKAPTLEKEAEPVPDGEPVPGWPIKKGSGKGWVKVTAPGSKPPDTGKWKKGVPGPGFMATVFYKGKNYIVGISGPDEKGKPIIEVLYPNGMKKEFGSPNAAGDSLYLFENALPLDMTGTEKKEKGISLGSKVLKFKEFQKELSQVYTGGEPPDPIEQDVKELEEAKVVQPEQKELSQWELLQTHIDGVISPFVLPPFIQEFLEETANPIGEDWPLAIAPGQAVKVTAESGGFRILAACVGDYGEPTYKEWSNLTGEAGNEFFPTMAKKADEIWKLHDIPEISEHKKAVTKPTPKTVEEKQGIAPEAELPKEAKVPENAKKTTKGPLPPGSSVTVKKKFTDGKHDVTLTVLESTDGLAYGVQFDEETEVHAFDSLSAASDFVWVNQKGYNDTADYKEKNNTNKVPSGGGWKFWGINAKKTPKKAKVPEAKKVAGEWAALPNFASKNSMVNWLFTAPVGTELKTPSDMVYVKESEGWMNPGGFVVELKSLAHAAVVDGLDMVYKEPEDQAGGESEDNFETMPEVSADTLNSAPVGSEVKVGDGLDALFFVKKGPNHWERVGFTGSKWTDASVAAVKVSAKGGKFIQYPVVEAAKPKTEVVNWTPVNKPISKKTLGEAAIGTVITSGELELTKTAEDNWEKTGTESEFPDVAASVMLNAHAKYYPLTYTGDLGPVSPLQFDKLQSLEPSDVSKELLYGAPVGTKVLVDMPPSPMACQKNEDGLWTVPGGVATSEALFEGIQGKATLVTYTPPKPESEEAGPVEHWETMPLSDITESFLDAFPVSENAGDAILWEETTLDGPQLFRARKIENALGTGTEWIMERSSTKGWAIIGEGLTTKEVLQDWISPDDDTVDVLHVEQQATAAKSPAPSKSKAVELHVTDISESYLDAFDDFEETGSALIWLKNDETYRATKTDGVWTVSGQSDGEWLPIEKHLSSEDILADDWIDPPDDKVFAKVKVKASETQEDAKPAKAVPESEPGGLLTLPKSALTKKSLEEMGEYDKTGEMIFWDEYAVRYRMFKKDGLYVVEYSPDKGKSWQAKGLFKKFGFPTSMSDFSLAAIEATDNKVFVTVPKDAETPPAEVSAANWKTMPDKGPTYVNPEDVFPAFFKSAPIGAWAIATIDGEKVIYRKGTKGSWGSVSGDPVQSNSMMAVKLGKANGPIEFQKGESAAPTVDFWKEHTGSGLVMLNALPEDKAFFDAAPVGSSYWNSTKTGAQSLKRKLESGLWEDVKSGATYPSEHLIAAMKYAESASVQPPASSQKPEDKFETEADQWKPLPGKASKELFASGEIGTEVQIADGIPYIKIQKDAWKKKGTDQLFSDAEMGFLASGIEANSKFTGGFKQEKWSGTVSTADLPWSKVSEAPYGAVIEFVDTHGIKRKFVNVPAVGWVAGDGSIHTPKAVADYVYDFGAGNAVLSMTSVAEEKEESVSSAVPSYKDMKLAPEGTTMDIAFGNGKVMTLVKVGQLWEEQNPSGDTTQTWLSSSIEDIFDSTGFDSVVVTKPGTPKAKPVVEKKSLANIPDNVVSGKGDLPEAVHKNWDSVQAQMTEWKKKAPGVAHAQAEKPGDWPDWAPPPGVVLEGEHGGKKYWLVTAISGYGETGESDGIYRCAILTEDGKVHLSAEYDGMHAEVALKESGIKAGIIEDTFDVTMMAASKVLLKKVFKLDKHKFAPGETVDTVMSGTGASALPEKSENKDEVVKVTVTAMQAIQNHPKLQGGTLSIKPAKPKTGKPSAHYICLDGVDNAAEILNEALVELGLDQHMKTKGKYPKTNAMGALTTIYDEVLNNNITVEMPSLEAEQSTTPSADNWETMPEGIPKIVDPANYAGAATLYGKVLKKAPPGTIIAGTTDKIFIKTDKGEFGNWNVLASPTEGDFWKKDLSPGFTASDMLADKDMLTVFPPGTSLDHVAATLGPKTKAKADAAKKAAAAVAKKKKATEKAAKKKQAEAKKKLEELKAKAVEIAEWGKKHPSVSDKKALMALAEFQKGFDLHDVPVGAYAKQDGEYILLGSKSEPGKFKAMLEDFDKGKTFPHPEVDTPFGKMHRVKASDLIAHFLGEGEQTITGPDGKEYPTGTTFTEKKTEYTAKQLVSSKVYKILDHKTAEDLAVLKIAGGGEEQVQKMKDLVKEFGLAGPFEEPKSTGSKVIHFVTKESLSKVVKTETEHIPKVPKQPAPWVQASLPYIGTSQIGQEAVGNREDLAILDTIKMPIFGHSIRMSRPGVLRNFEMRVRKVKTKSGEMVYEFSGDLLNFKGGNGMEHGSVPYLSCAGTDDPATGFKLLTYNEDEGYHDESVAGGVTVPAKGLKGSTAGGTFIQVAQNYEATLKDHVRIRVPVNSDVEKELAEAFEKLGYDSEKALAATDEECDRIRKKASIVQSGMGAKGWSKEPQHGFDWSKAHDEDYLDAKLKELGLKTLVKTATIKHAFQGGTVVEVEDANRFKKAGWFFPYVGTSEDGAVAQILQGAGWSARKDRFTMGTYEEGKALHGTGMSADSDVQTGGSQGTFFRVAGKKNALSTGYYVDFIAKPKLFKRTDWWRFNGDGFGKTSSGGPGQSIESAKTRKQTVLTAENNEIVFEKGVALEDMVCALADNESIAKRIRKKLKDSGITEINGKSLEEFVQVKGHWDGEAVYNKYIKGKEDGE